MDETAHFMDETAHFLDESVSYVTFQSYGSKGHFMDETAKHMEKKNTSQVYIWYICHHTFTFYHKIDCVPD
jgi:hypothetical protein